MQHSPRATSALVWCALALMFAYRISHAVVDLDLFHQLALARELVRSGHFPATDPFAFTPTHAPVIHHEWGAGVIAYAVATRWGASGILALRNLIAAALAVVAVRTSMRRPEARPVAWALAPFALLLADYGFSPVRAQAYSFLFAAATLWCIERDREGSRRWMLGYAALFAAWVNLHGGFVVGAMLLLVHALEQWSRGRPYRHVLGFLIVLGAIVTLNPWGPAYYPYLVRALTMHRPSVEEWSPLWSASVPTHHQAAFVVSAGLVLYGVARRRSWRELEGMGLLVLCAALAVRHHRMLPFYAVAFMVYAPRLVAGTALGGAIASLPVTFRRPLGAGAAAAIVGFSAIVVASWHLEIPGVPSEATPMSYPVGAANYLRAASFRGNVLTPFEQGAFVSWKLYPDVKVSLDSRYEAAYPDWLVEEIVGFYNARSDPGRVLDRYAPDLLLVPASARVRSHGLSWPVVYEDAGFALYARPGLHLNAPAGPVSLTDSFP